MGWLENIARSLGLMIHNVKNPDDPKGVSTSEHKVINHEVEEERRGNVTLRRTTIEEIEIHNDPQDRESEQDH